MNWGKEFKEKNKQFFVFKFILSKMFLWDYWEKEKKKLYINFEVKLCLKSNSETLLPTNK